MSQNENAVAEQSPARKRARRGWLLYDVANSAFVTTVITAVGGPFLTAIAKASADESGRVALLGLHPRADALYAYVTSISVLIQVLTLPVLGVLADRPGSKRKLLGASTALGVLATLVLAMTPTGAWLMGAIALAVANVSYGSAILAYNAYLAEVAEREERDKVSARGFALGYAGGAFVLVLNLVLLSLGESWGIEKGTAVRISIMTAALWWGALGAVAVAKLGSVAELGELTIPSESMGAAVRATMGELRNSVRELRALPETFRYLIAFLLFNDAIQAVVALSAVVLTHELYTAQGLPESEATGFLLQLVLLIQVVAIGGALLFARIAARTGAKRAILGSLVIWSAVVIYAVSALETQRDAYLMGVVIALVLGGSQSLARSLFSKMVPTSRQASFFAFYELAERGTAWIGALMFAVVLDLTNSYRGALGGLLVLFVLGGIVLSRVRVDRAIEEAEAMEQTLRGGEARP